MTHFETWRLFFNRHEPLTTADGLALDETLPRSVSENRTPPILHLYTFRPSVIVGKYQDIGAAINIDRCRARDIEYNRRSTGGGTVIMGPQIVALGFGINMDHPGLRPGIGGVFESLSQVLIAALKDLGIQSRFRPKNDIEISGKKIAGLSAALETHKALLFHTSLLVDFDYSLMADIMNTPSIKLADKGYSCFSQRMTTVREQLHRDVSISQVMDKIKRAFERVFQIRFIEDEPDAWERKMVRVLIKEKYTAQGWIFSHKHPRTRMGVGHLKTRAGLLEIYLSLSGGSIENVMITGDFFSTDEAVNRLENALKWTSARPEMIEKNLNKVWQHDMIHGLDVPSLTQAIVNAKQNQVRV